MELFADSYELQALRDESQWLLQCLHASERSCSQLQSVVKQQQRRIKQLEKATKQPAAAAQLERQWTTRLQQKEREWMHEYDEQMQSLLRIIQHHESVRAQLERELNEARAAKADCVSSASQTDFLSDDDEAVGARGMIQQVAAAAGDGCSSCSHVGRHQELGVDCARWYHTEPKEDRSAHPFAIQVRHHDAAAVYAGFLDSHS